VKHGIEAESTRNYIGSSLLLVGGVPHVIGSGGGKNDDDCEHSINNGICIVRTEGYSRSKITSKGCNETQNDEQINCVHHYCFLLIAYRNRINQKSKKKWHHFGRGNRDDTHGEQKQKHAVMRSKPVRR